VSAPETNSSLKSVPILSRGSWIEVAADRSDKVFNPSTGQAIARVPLCSASQTKEVVQSAVDAFDDWNETPVVERARLMFKLRQLMEARFNEIAELVTREHGKTLAESRAEVQRAVEMVEFACGIPSLIVGETLPNIARDVDAETVRYPLGVCVGITPYNFPSMVPMWMIPVALVCGNTFVLKPSEKTPLSANLIGELLKEAGLPDGVFNIVHGDKESVDTLLTHPDVAAISFVGSTPIAKYIYETGTKNGKRVQAAGGAKNHLIIMPDADLDISIKALAASAFGCGGQRCMAGSIAVAIGSIGDPLVDGLREHASQMRVGASDGNEDVDMGPLIRREHVDRVGGYMDVASGEGASVALDGRRDFAGDGFLIGPSVIDQVETPMKVAQEEIFGPVLSVMRSTDLDSVIKMGKECPFGNGASIFTRDGYAARHFKRHFNAGMIGINVGVPAPMPWFPFTGWNQSFFGDLHIQGTESVQFYTQQKMTLTRWFGSPTDSHADPVWKTEKQG
jgi:malonate-semialdehyde dehydrogenase (acetylating)/methylmalonate-semialdehyde dehydrogenase